MKQIFRRIYTQVPKKYKNDIALEINKENLYRIFIATIIMVISEVLIYIFFKEQILGTEKIVYLIILVNLLFSPLSYYMYKNVSPSLLYIGRFMQIVYIYFMFFFCCVLCLIPQQDFISMNTYIMILFATAAFFYFHPLESMSIYVIVYIGFFIALPYYQSNSDIVVVLRVNAFIMNVFAWIIGRMVYRMKIISLINHKIIEKKNELLKDMAMKDSMTSLINHENIFYKLRDELEMARLYKSCVSVMMIDIDNFKSINDQYGHQIGDKIIIGITKIIVDQCRKTDIIGRYGGDEFVIIMPGTDSDGAVYLGERIRSTIETTVFCGGVHVTISAGIGEYKNESMEEYFKKVDEQLYKAKNKGRNRVECLEYIIS